MLAGALLVIIATRHGVQLEPISAPRQPTADAVEFLDEQFLDGRLK